MDVHVRKSVNISMPVLSNRELLFHKVSAAAKSNIRGCTNFMKILG